MRDDMTKLAKLQNEAEVKALQWWREETNEAKMLVWSKIQQMGGDYVDEVISLLAQLGMTHLALLADKQAKEN